MDLITKTQLLNDTLPALSNNLRLDVKYTDMNGTAIAPEALKQGSDFMAVVTVANISGTTDYSDIARYYRPGHGDYTFDANRSGKGQQCR